ncbi:MAG TPA: tetratricopeptide repeat protein [Pyrinomonadaceae bacterium]|nr:tetratricopeptide repeat protein [Pyrinomonadaceae bacterium]
MTTTKSPFGLRYLQLALAALLVSSAALAVSAQGVTPGSSRGLSDGDGNNSIQGRVLFPPGQAGSQVKVNLESVSTFGSMSTATDQDGTFRFRGLRPGYYTVVVDAGSQYEKGREPLTIDPGSSGRIAQVVVELHFKADASNPAFAGVPQNALNLYQKGTAAAQKGDNKAAAEFFSQAVAAHPAFALALSELAFQYMKLNQMDKAGETYEALLKLKPNDAVAHLNLGIVMFNKKKFEDAEMHLRKALELNSSGPTGHYYLGLTLISLKRYNDALPEFETTVANGGDNLALAHKYLGGLYMSAHKNKEAADELEKYLKLDPKAPDAERIKGTIKELRDKH